MKFSLFAHMDRSHPDETHEQLYQDFIGLCRLADQGGMHAIWTGEHHGMDFTITPNPFLSLIDIAHHTQSVRLGTGTIVAPFWHPIKLAGEAAMADLLTGGRLDLGIARGAYSYEYERLHPGLEAWEAGQRLREMVPLLHGLWQGDCAHKGEFWSFPETTPQPRPVQEGGPPVWIAARDPNSHLFAVSNRCNVQVTPLWQGWEEIESLMTRFNVAVDEAGVARPKIMLLHHTYVAADGDEADQAAEALSEFFCNFGAWFQNKRRVAQGRIDPLSDEEMAANAMMAPGKLRQDLTVGTAAEVIERLKRVEDLGYDEFAVWLDNGMAPETKRVVLSRFMDEVMPAFV
ncbi:MAG: LLM class flavin-dependent oxidoreductase [Pseudomonadota bacterium]